MLAGRFIPYHFREEVDGEALRFDYAIKSGASSTQNAIARLRLMKYPDRVVAYPLTTVNLGQSTFVACAPTSVTGAPRNAAHDMAHCKGCAEACQRCADACRKLAG